jgi:hypothetical protein
MFYADEYHFRSNLIDFPDSFCYIFNNQQMDYFFPVKRGEQKAAFPKPELYSITVLVGG